MEVLSLALGLGAFALLAAVQSALAVLNVVAIDVEAGRAPLERQGAARRLGIGAAALMRILFLALGFAIFESAGAPLVSIDWIGVLEGRFGLDALSALGGGALMLAVAGAWIARLLALRRPEADVERRGQMSAVRAGLRIGLINLSFAALSALTAILLGGGFAPAALGVVLGGLAMMLAADRARRLLTTQRMRLVGLLYALFALGLVSLSLGAGAAGLKIFGVRVEPVSMATFYFSVVVMLLVDILQRRSRARLMAEQRSEVQRNV